VRGQQVKAQGFSRGGAVTTSFRKTSNWVRVKSVTIPQRQFLPDARGLPLPWETRLEAVARRVVRAQLKGGRE
jgi:hypothetical protein